MLSSIVMRDDRLTRFCEWLRGVPIAARLWLLDRIAGSDRETEADFGSERRGARVPRRGYRWDRQP